MFSRFIFNNFSSVLTFRVHLLRYSSILIGISVKYLSAKIRAQATYTEANKMAKKNIRADKRAYLNSLAVEADEATHHGNMGSVSALWNI